VGLVLCACGPRPALNYGNLACGLVRKTCVAIRAYDMRVANAGNALANFPQLISFCHVSRF